MQFNGHPAIATEQVASSTDRTVPCDAPTTVDWIRLVVLAGLTVVLVALCVWLAVPFLPAITWAVALAIIARPLHIWMSRHIARPDLAAAASSATVALLIMVPLTVVGYQLAREAGAAAQAIQTPTDGDVREKLSDVPGFDQVVAWMDRAGMDLEQTIRGFVAAHTQDAAALVQGSLSVAIQNLVALFILFYLFRDRAQLTQAVRNLLPLSRAETARVFQSASDSVHASLYATLATGLMDGIGGGFMFWLLGLPSPILWGSVIFMLSVVPLLGAAMVWLPAAVYLAMNGRSSAGLALVAWGVGEWFLVGNIVYVRLAGNRMRMHPVPTLIAFLGGLAIFGISGMILGPAIVAVTAALLEVWRHRDESLSEETHALTSSSSPARA
ncbi:MAG: AI-2E family transporter [Gemmataceae bacterium]|nr:AI-2E family transporter [Gemmataceae bacterium]